MIFIVVDSAALIKDGVDIRGNQILRRFHNVLYLVLLFMIMTQVAAKTLASIKEVRCQIKLGILFPLNCNLTQSWKILYWQLEKTSTN